MSEERDLLVETLDVLYGDGAWEIAKASTKESRERTQARVGLGSNIIGLAAGAAGTKAAYDEFKNAKAKKDPWANARPHPSVNDRQVGPRATGAKLKMRKVTGWMAKHPRQVAGAALALQVTNVAGDAVANRVLARSSKAKVAKSADWDGKPASAKEFKYKLVKRGVDGTANAAKQAPKVSAKAMAKAQQVPEFAQATVKTIKKNVDIEVRGEVSKMNTDLKQVFGWASVIEMDGEPVIDLQGDVMTIDTIEKAAYNYVHGSRKGGRQHERAGEEPLHVSDMIESFVLTPEKKSQMGIPESVPTGWWVGFQVNDDDTWQAYKDGKLKEFSIHGSGTRKALEL